MPPTSLCRLLIDPRIPVHSRLVSWFCVLASYRSAVEWKLVKPGEHLG